MSYPQTHIEFLESSRRGGTWVAINTPLRIYLRGGFLLL
jgi:hypothetical protein